MTHSPISIQSISLTLPHKICFEDFSTWIYPYSRIAIMGRNGSGKTSLLEILQGLKEPTDGSVSLPEDVVLAAVPQIMGELSSLSGGERFNKALTHALKSHPNLLLLDEPTNHLDQAHRRSLFRMIHHFPGTVIMVTHDVEILRSSIDTLWHVDQGKIHIFSGTYDAYQHERHNRHQALVQKIAQIDRHRKEAHHALMKEQERAKKSDQRGEKSIHQRKWPTMVSDEKARRALETSGKKKRALREEREELSNQLSQMRLPEVILPKFHLSSADLSEKTILSIRDGRIGFTERTSLLKEITFSITSKERVTLKGPNGCGKTTLLRAILGDSSILKSGDWYTPKIPDIGYLDQHYSTLFPHKTVLESLSERVSHWEHALLRRHLNDFLFRKNEEVRAQVHQLSGGEKARLSLALIAAAPPKLLILDEVTNNLDLETRDHVLQVLQSYPGAMILVSHDEDFLRQIGSVNSLDISRFKGGVK